MRRILLLLCLFLLCSLAACGEEPASDAVPMPTDGGDEAQIQLDPNDPLSNYLDLSQLPAETVSAATQTLDLTSESNGCQAVLQKAVGDAMTLYLSVAVTYPEGVDLSASLPLAQTSGSGSYGTTSVVLTEGTVTDPGQMPAESDLEGLSGVGLQSSQMGDHTLQYLITLHFQDAVLTPGREVTLLFADQLGDNTHLFHWTVENQAPVQQAELAADDGTVVGTGVFSPFAACLTFPDGSLLRGRPVAGRVGLPRPGRGPPPRLPGDRHHRRRHQCACDFGGPGLRPHDARGDSRSANRHTDLPGPLDRQPILTLCKPEGIPLRFFLSFVAVSMHFCGILRLL